MPWYLSEADVRRATAGDPHYRGAVETLETAFAAYERGEVVTPLEERQRIVWPPGQQRRPYPRDMRILSAMVPWMDTTGVHIGCNSVEDGGFTSYMLLMDFTRLRPLALMEDYFLHTIRAGAPTGIAVNRWALPEAATLGVIGSGKIADIQVAVTTGFRAIERIRVFSPHPERRRAFARKWAETLRIPVDAVAHPREAVIAADIVTVATNSYHEPVMDGRWLKPGALVASVTPGEMDPETPRRSRVIVTSRNRIVHDYTPFEPLAGLIAAGEMDLAAIPTLGEVLNGLAPGRTANEETIWFASPGIGFCDVVVARWVYDLAREKGLGRPLESAD